MSMLELRPPELSEEEPYIRLSHSTLESWATCERKFEMDKLLTIGAPRQDSVHFSFGHAYGEFIATYLVTGSFEMAVFDGWMAYHPIIEDEKKNQATAYHLFQNSIDELDKIASEWEVAYFDGKPACELSFRVDIDGTFYYVGYIDVVLRNKKTGRYCVLENKSTGLQLEDISPLYKFSGQAIGYSIVVDAIAGENQAEYDVMYVVGRLGRTPFTDSTRCEVHTFKKSIYDRLEWFLQLGQDIERMHSCLTHSNFPRRHQGCLKFNRPCPHFGTCHMRSADHYRTIEVDEVEYQFQYKLDDLVDDHLRRIQDALESTS